MRWLIRLISFRHVLDAPVRTALTVVGVALGVATLVAITSINRAVLDAFRSTVDTVAGKADLSVHGPEGGFDEDRLELVRKTPGVAHAAGTLTVIAPVAERPSEALYVVGIDFLDDGYFRSFQGAGQDLKSLNNDLEFLNSTDRLLLSTRYAAGHELKVNDTLMLMTPQGKTPFIVHGLLDDSGPASAFGGSMAVMFFASAQEAFGRGRTFDRIDIKLEAQTSLETVRVGLLEKLGPTFDVDRPDRRGQSTETMLRSFQVGLNLGSGVALVVGVFLVYNTISIAVVQRRREVGTLRALGATRRSIRWLFAFEALILGSIGSALGVPLGVSLSRAAIGGVADSVSSLYVRVNPTDVRLQSTEVLVAVALGLFGSVFAALRPAMVASSISPVEALRRDGISTGGTAELKSWPTLVGVGLWLLAWPLSQLPPPVENFALGGYLSIFAVVFGLALLTPLMLRWLATPLGRPAQAAFGVTGRLAADNFARAPVRTAVPVSALAIGIAMAVAINGFVFSFQQSALKWIVDSVPADLFVTSSSKLAGTRSQPMALALRAQLKAIDGVAAVDPVRLVQHDVLGLRMYLCAVDSDIYTQHAHPTVLAGMLPTVEARRRGVVTVSENVAVRRNVRPGDRITIDTRTGAKQYEIGAVVVDYTSDQGVVLFDREVYERDFGDTQVDSYHLFVKPGADLQAVRGQVRERFGQQYNLYVLSNAELRTEALGLIDKAFAVTTAMEMVAVLLALLGVINTLLAAVIDRTREIGLFRAIGASRGHITQLFAAEASLMGLTGGILGVALGGVVGWLITTSVNLVATGWTFPYQYPWGTAAQLISIATACSLVAGLYPARRAAYLDVVEALAWE